jgi:siroheme synthase (precorrin-2 oxidase/ferrochelatase)
MEEWDIESTNGMDANILEKLQSELNGYIARISDVRNRVSQKIEKVKAKQELLDKIAELDKMKEEIMKKLEEI